MTSLRSTVSSLVVLVLFSSPAWAKTVHYELTATRGTVNLSGKQSVDFALMLNGSIPAPTLEFTEGDDAEIVVKNNIPDDELSLHWHGILLPPEMDGVPYLTTPPIKPGESLTFKFHLRQNGTYWYHSHTHTQEQVGLYGAIVIHPKVDKIKVDHDWVVVISDWADENGDDILKNLRKDGDYYLYKKNNVRSWLGAIKAGRLGTYLDNEWTRMGAMDLSDVGYDAFLINGKREFQFPATKPGERVRLRVISASSSSYFYVALGHTPLRVIAADGKDIVPVEAKELLMGMAETYDVLFTVPGQNRYELKATAQDGTGSASAWIGPNAAAQKIAAPVRPLPDPYASMDHMHHMNHDSMPAGMSMEEAMKLNPNMDMSGMDDEKSGPIELLTVDHLRSPVSTEFKTSKGKVYDVKLELNGDMGRYVWYMNGKTIYEDRNILVNEGDIVRFTFENRTMMHHPMHLHGHFFRVITQAAEYSPLKHTVDVGPHSSRTIEFRADEPGEWMLHCHNLFHMMSGMARIVKYTSYTPRADLAHLQHHDPHQHDHWYGYGMLEMGSSHAQAYLRTSQTWNQFELRLESRNTSSRMFAFSDRWETEGDLFYRRWIDGYLNFVGGATYFDSNLRAAVGVSYKLPLLVESQLLIDHQGLFRLDLEKRFQWTSEIYTQGDLTWRPNLSSTGSKNFEYELSLMYAPCWSWAAGLMLTEDTLGAGVEFRF